MSVGCILGTPRPHLAGDKTVALLYSLNAMGMLHNRQVGIIGYTEYGRPLALNLRDSGVDVIIGNYADEQAVQALREGFPTFSPAEAAARSEVLLVATPNALLTTVFESDLSPFLDVNKTLLFITADAGQAAGLKLPPDIDAGWLRPASIGEALRESYLRRKECQARFIALQDCSGRLNDTVDALAQALRVLLTPS